MIINKNRRENTIVEPVRNHILNTILEPVRKHVYREINMFSNIRYKNNTTDSI